MNKQTIAGNAYLTGKAVKQLKRALALYNFAVSLVWSAISLVPITVFCYSHISLPLFYLFLAISLLPLFFSRSFINRLQVGKTATTYKKLGVHLVNKVSQNGVLINALLKKKFPAHKIITSNERLMARLIGQTYLFEKFHLSLFLFFCFITVYCFAHKYASWGFVLLLTNVVYNIYPNLLQQYIRLKLRLFGRRHARLSGVGQANNITQ